MGYWGKRQALAVFMSVWVVGCSSLHEAAPTMPPTSTPILTLIALAPTQQSPPPPTALPTAAPEPAPTGVAYAIQAGDTLLGIARQFGVPVSTLEAANTGLNPLALPIGATLMIPAPIFDVVGRPILPSATPSALQADPPLCIPMPTGSLICLGQIINRLPLAVSRVTFTIRVTGRDGHSLGEVNAGLEQSVILPQHSAPYRVMLAADWRQVRGSAFVLRSADEQPADGRYLEMAVESESIRRAGAQVTLLARVRAPAAAANGARLLRAVLTLYDARGQVIGFRALPLAATLPPDATFALQITAAALTGEPVAHSFYVEAERMPP